jgi:PKHD-type hydroxylase
MQYLLTPYAKNIEPFVWWDGAFTEEELNWLQEKAKAATQDASVGGGPGKNGWNPDVRRSKVAWLSNTSETVWVFEKLGKIASKLNADWFRFDLTGFGELMQLTNYVVENNGMYDWHQDYNAEVSRKLSLVLQLSDPSEYEGGNLQIKTTSEPKTVQKRRGLVVAFPSYTLHQVTPVIQGTRQSLVTWVSGPQFK